MILSPSGRIEFSEKIVSTKVRNVNLKYSSTMVTWTFSTWVLCNNNVNSLFNQNRIKNIRLRQSCLVGDAHPITTPFYLTVRWTVS